MSLLDFFGHIRDKVPLESIIANKVRLKRKGTLLLGLCPFHSEKTPSFTVNELKKFYHCFGCGVSGDVIKFISETLGISYKDAATHLAKEYDIPLPNFSEKSQALYKESEIILHALDLAKNFFVSQAKDNKQVKEFLKRRSLSLDVVNKYEIGFAPKGGLLQKFLESKNIPFNIALKAGLVGINEDGSSYELFRERVIFPIKNVFNKTIAFGGRVLNDSLPKYLNSPNTSVFNKSEALYGENIALSAAYKQKRFIIVEGYIDVIRLQSNGFEEAVASLGTAVGEEHLTKMWGTADEIIACLDGDEAGVNANLKLINIALPLVTPSKTVSFLFLPPNKDPDEIIKQNGEGYLSDLISSRVSISEAIWNIETLNKRFSKAEDFAVLESRLTQYSKKIKDNLLSKNFYSFFKNKIYLLKTQSNKKNKVFTKKGDYNSEALFQAQSLQSEMFNFGKNDREHNEFCVLVFLIRYPDFLDQERSVIKNFENNRLNDLLAFISNESETLCLLKRANIENYSEKFRDFFEKAGFSEIYSILLQFKSFFLERLFQKNIDPQIIWDILLKKYYLSIINHEFEKLNKRESDLFSKGQGTSFEKLQAYINEILKLRSDIDEILQQINE